MPKSQPRIIAHRRAHLALVVLSYVLTPGTLIARDLGCLQSLAPLSGLFSSAPTGLAHSDGISVCASIANHATRGEAGTERFLFDGETTHVSVLGRYTVGRWQFGARVPMIRHSGGALDKLIENWHDAFGLPNGIRDDLVDDQLAFVLQQAGNPAIELDRSSSGIGDFSVHATSLLRRSDSASLAIEVFARLPSGNVSRFSGTGAAAAGVALIATTDQVAGTDKLRAEGFVQLTHSGTTKFAVLDQRRTQWQLFGRLRYHWSDRWSVAGGIGLGSAPLRSQLRPFKEVAVALEASLTRRFEKYEISAGFAEDLRVSTHPDVTFRLQFRQH